MSPLQGQQYYLYQAVDQDGDVIAILLQRHRNQRAAKRFFRRLIKSQGSEPRWLFADKLRSYAAAHRIVMPTMHHVSMRIIERKSRINRHGNKGGRWEDFVHLSKRHVFSRSMDSPKISFALAVT
ncbi:MAG: DDE-type integrase/transposase/recombinase [Nitrospirales bacterium]